MPAAQPYCGAAKDTNRNNALVPLVCGFHVLPPSSVCRMVPLSPTAQPDCGVAKTMEYRSALVLLVCGFQLPPPCSVCRMVP